MQIITLVNPINRPPVAAREQEVISVVTMRRPMSKDFENVNLANIQVQDLQLVLSRITNLTLEELRNLDMMQFVELQTKLDKLMAKK